MCLFVCFIHYSPQLSLIFQITETFPSQKTLLTNISEGMCGKKKNERKNRMCFLHEHDQNFKTSLRVKSCDLAPVMVAESNVSTSEMTKINCPLELEGS